ncbi:hypothetical protein D3C87_1780570 [compost metagenome]
MRVRSAWSKRTPPITDHCGVKAIRCSPNSAYCVVLLRKRGDVTMPGGLKNRPGSKSRAGTVDVPP